MSKRIVRLTDVCDFQGGTQPPKSNFLHVPTEGYIRLLQIQDFKSDENAVFIPDTKNLKKCDETDVLIARYGASIGKVLKGKSGAYNVALVKTCPDLNVLSKEYLYYLLSSYQFQNFIKNVGSRAAQAGFNKSELSDFEFNLPPLSEQKRIAAILDKADAVRHKRQETIRLLDEFLKSVFLEIFGDPVRNEKGWEKRRLEEFCEIITGNTPSRDEKENYGDFIEWIKSDNINTSYHFITKADEYLSEIGLKKGRSVDKGSILMTCIAGSLSCIGNIALVDRKVTFNQQINAIIPKNVDLYFLYAQLLFSKKYIQSASTNSMKGMISKGTLSKLQFIIPPNEDQNLFASFFSKYLHQRGLLEKSLSEMENSFNSMMQKAFRGEL